MSRGLGLAMAVFALLAAPRARAFHDVYYEGMRCEPCGVTSFCTGGGRFDCPAHSLTEFSHEESSPSDIDDCVCLPGFNRTGDECQLAPPGAFYYREGLALPCPQFQRTYQTGPSELRQCVCVPGFILVGGACQQCAPDSFNPAPNQTACQGCPARSSHARLGSTVVTDCECDAGAYSVSTDAAAVACSLCAGGTAKGASGPAACSMCANNTFSNGTGATECFSCHAQSVAPGGSDFRDDCLCLPGFEDRGGESCAACAVGKNKAVTSNAACAFCGPVNFQNTTGQSFCYRCVAFSGATPARDSCSCFPGYTTNPPLGAFVSAPTCESCPANTYKVGDNQNACVQCGTFMQSQPASGLQSQCLCNEGFRFTGSFATCTACGAGTYKPTVGNGPSDCQACTPHSLSPINSTARGDCACNAGFTPDDEECAPCGPGHFKAQPGGGDCDSCAEGTYNPNLNATRCLDCYADAVSLAASVALDACECLAGDELNASAGACEACPPGSFSAIQDSECASCVGGKFTSTPGRTECDVCEQHSLSHDFPHAACQCDAGYDTQQLCPPATSCFRCRACPASFYKPLHGDVGCVRCQANSQSVAASVLQAACQCSFGYRQDGDSACAACGPGLFSDTLDALSCETCADGQFANESATAVCHVCWSRSGSNMAHTGCDCLPGATPAGAFACAPCASNYYKETRDNTECVLCRSNSQSQPGASLVAQCLCNPGFYLLGAAADGVCTPCPVGSVKTGPGNGACTPCPDSLTTEFEQAALQLKCVCAPGLVNVAGVCGACPADYYKPEFSNALCTICRSDSSSPAEELADDEYDCLCDPGFDDHPRDPGRARLCEACAPGTSKDALSNAACAPCAPNSFSAAFGSLTCAACPAASSTHGQSGRVACECVVGFARRGAGVSGCEACAAGKFKDNFRNADCSECQVCAVDEEVTRECSSTQQIACARCPAHSSSLGRRRSRAGPCDCNAGFELVGGVCTACVPGSFKDHTNNSYPCVGCAVGKFAPGHGSVGCVSCRAHCEDAGVAPAFVAAECNASRNVQCAACTVCAPGTVAEPRCGLHSNYDRRDTVCVQCPAGFFCSGDAHRERCTNNAQSLPGSSTRAACGCRPGFRGDENGCEQCGFDTYCSEGQETNCPEHSVTHGRENTVVYDCHCHHGFYRVAVLSSGADDFLCAVCTVDDYCFNNSRYNCSDERMSAVSGSDAAADCRCADGFYNNADNTECLDCEVGHFCVNGTQTACAAAEWTQNQTRQQECTCRPGLRREHADCVPCGPGQFCKGDDFAETCRPHSATPNLRMEAYRDCLCAAGYAETRHGGGQETCVSCVEWSTFKTHAGNHACSACTRCLASGVFTNVWCTTATDATCDACDACDDDNEFAQQVCVELYDAQCAVCHACDYAREFETQACSSSQDRHCAAFSTDTSTCPVGFYRGGHTRTSDSGCLLCKYNDTLLHGSSLHTASTRGAEYNNAYSCGAACLGNSRWRDAARPFLGCETCETGNALLKVFPGDMSAASTCEFTCRAGYERLTLPDGSDDCFSPRLMSSERTDSTHDLFVGDYSWSRDVSTVRVSHTDHGFFVVVVGAEAPAACKFGGATCCYAAHYRVSTLAQMGLGAADLAAAPCVGLSNVSAVRTSSTSLFFALPDADIQAVAACRQELGSRVCVLVVALVDLITLRVVSKRLEIRSTRAVVVAHSTREKQMLPLSLFDVRVALWRVLPSGAHVFRVETVASGAAMSMQTRVTGMSALADAPACERFSQTNLTRLLPGAATHIVPASNSSTVSYWQAGAHVDTVKVVFHLAMLGQTHNVMDVAAVREVRHLVPACVLPVLAASYAAGQVWFAAGLGADAVFRMRRGAGASAPAAPDAEPAHGKLASLLTFVGESTIVGTSHISLDRILAAHVRTQAGRARLANATEYRPGALDFTPAFRTCCLSEPRECAYEYMRAHSASNNVFQVRSCSPAEQAHAVLWLRANFGVVHDAGHVAAVCARQQALLPWQSLAVLVNTMKHTSRERNRWNMFQNSTASSIESRVWADFQFEGP